MAPVRGREEGVGAEATASPPVIARQAWRVSGSPSRGDGPPRTPRGRRRRAAGRRRLVLDGGQAAARAWRQSCSAERQAPRRWAVNDRRQRGAACHDTAPFADLRVMTMADGEAHPAATSSSSQCSTSSGIGGSRSGARGRPPLERARLSGSIPRRPDPPGFSSTPPTSLDRAGVVVRARRVVPSELGEDSQAASTAKSRRDAGRLTCAAREGPGRLAGERGSGCSNSGCDTLMEPNRCSAFVLKDAWIPEGDRRRLVAELWSRGADPGALDEVPAGGGAQVAGQARVFLTRRGTVPCADTRSTAPRDALELSAEERRPRLEPPDRWASGPVHSAGDPARPRPSR